MCGFAGAEEGQIGVDFGGLMMVWRVVVVLEVGVMEGTQKEGRVVFDAFLLMMGQFRVFLLNKKGDGRWG